MDLGTTQNQQPTGGEIFSVYMHCMVAACIFSSRERNLLMHGCCTDGTLLKALQNNHCILSNHTHTYSQVHTQVGEPFMPVVCMMSVMCVRVAVYAYLD